MSDKNQEQERADSVTDNQTGVDKSKRKFSKAGLAAPVIMTLAAKPVFAAQGLSNMISGNGSGCQGDVFEGGLGQAFWQDDVTNAMAWNLALGTTGTGYQTVTIATAFSGHTLPGTGVSTLLDVIVNSSAGWEIVLGYLNLFYFLNGGAGTYFLTVSQFWDLNDGVTPIDTTPYPTFADLITSNIGLGPGSVCGP